MKHVLYILFIVFSMVYFVVTGFGCGSSSVPDAQVVTIPGDPADPSPESIDIAGLYVSDSNASEALIYSDGRDVYVSKIHLEFTNSYGGVEYQGSFDLTGGFYSANIDNVVEVRGPVFKCAGIVTTTVAPTDILTFVSNYTTTPGYHKSYLVLKAVSDGLNVRVIFDGSPYYRDSLTYYNRTFKLRKAR